VRPYRDREDERESLSRSDGSAQQAGEGAFAAIREQQARYDAALVVGIDPQGSGAAQCPSRGGAGEVFLAGRDG